MAHQLAPLTEKPESLTQIVYQTLRDAIISKRLPPGERVSEASLARQLRVSKTPVREARLPGITRRPARRGAGYPGPAQRADRVCRRLPWRRPGPGHRRIPAARRGV